ncbi:MAG: hypothetical protein CVU43_13340 [Chloroflexi bacterium HGW-Chloroflexi-5]|jgi:uncharacterized protein YjcR|nr:MAG: hypothetical protein CVU43_13340 [Chloroflexi bacterium HGW-Chloroflexi-5]
MSNLISKKRGAQPGNTNAKQIIDQPAQNPKKEISGKKRGAPVGNKNALTHGFYSRRLKARSLEGLEDVGVNSLKDEIEVMRIFSRKVAELGDTVEDLDQAQTVLNTLSNSTSTINRLIRTNTYIPRPEDDPAALLKQAIEELEEEWPEFKKLTDKYRTPEQIAEVDARIVARQAREEEARLRGEFVDGEGNPYPLNNLFKTDDDFEFDEEVENDDE